jgi:hypothetical protein
MPAPAVRRHIQPQFLFDVIRLGGKIVDPGTGRDSSGNHLMVGGCHAPFLPGCCADPGNAEILRVSTVRGLWLRRLIFGRLRDGRLRDESVEGKNDRQDDG